VIPGIVHFGPGAFHRAHQAWFIEKLLADDSRWGICAVSLRSSDVRDALAPQHNLYSLALRGESMGFQVIGAIREILIASESSQAVLQRLAAPTTRVVTATVTEKGYCLTGDGLLNPSSPEIAHDLRNPRVPTSLIGFVVEGLRLRRAAGLTPYVSISCDNLPDNGAKLARAVIAFAQEIDPELARWIEGEAHFPSTMVDSITPTTTAQLRRESFEALRLTDRWPVQRESFAQWVIEERGSSAGPDWQSAGVTLTDDVAAYDRAKLRVVNGSHSTLAYLGSLLGHRTVFEAMSDKTLVTFLCDLIDHDIRPTLAAPRGMDLHSYVRDVLARFENPNLRHELAQIAWDGSQKLPPRLLSVIEDALRAGRSVDRLCVPVAAWMRFVCRAAKRGDKLVDPLASALEEIGSNCSGTGIADVPRFLALERIFPRTLVAEPRFTRPLTDIYDGKNTRELTWPEALRNALRQELTRDGS
jgi:fructuronate reductase